MLCSPPSNHHQPLSQIEHFVIVKVHIILVNRKLNLHALMNPGVPYLTFLTSSLDK